MNNVFKSTKLDHYILKPYYKVLTFLYVVAILVGLITRLPELTIFVVMMITAPFIGTYFSIYEKNNLSKLYGILPIGRNEVVIGRYLYALLFGLATLIISTLIAYILALILNSGLNSLEFIAFVSAAFFFFCLFVAVEFLVYFKFSFSKAYVVTSLPFYLVYAVCVYILRKTDILKNLSQTIQYFTSHPIMIWVAGFGVGLILLLISCPLSCKIYQKNEL